MSGIVSFVRLSSTSTTGFNQGVDCPLSDFLNAYQANKPTYARITHVLHGSGSRQGAISARTAEACGVHNRLIFSTKLFHGDLAGTLRGHGLVLGRGHAMTPRLRPANEFLDRAVSAHLNPGEQRTPTMDQRS